MPYLFDALKTPLDDKHFWERLDEIWLLIRNDLMNVHFETEEEALDKVYRKSLDPNDLRLDSWGVARYRDTDDRDNLGYFHGLGLDALGTTEIGLAKRSLDAHFMDQWSLLLACHGFVAAAMMARGPDVEGKRAGLAGTKAVSIQDQRQWFSHYYLREREMGRSRSETEAAVWALINAIVDGDVGLSANFQLKWFEKFLNLQGDAKVNPSFGQLTYAFRQTRLSEKQMRELVKLPHDHLPPLDLKLPKP